MIKKKALPNKPGDRYDICDHCSHKFFVLQLYQEYSAKAEVKDALLKKLQQSYNEKKDEYLKIRAKHNKQKREVNSTKCIIE